MDWRPTPEPYPVTATAGGAEQLPAESKDGHCIALGDDGGRTVALIVNRNGDLQSIPADQLKWRLELDQGGSGPPIAQPWGQPVGAGGEGQPTG
jgi:hypothetical protein